MDGIVYDTVPGRGKGRPLRPMENALATLPGARSDTPRCRECDRWKPATKWCPLRAEPNNGRGPMCKYGIVLLRARRLKDRRLKGVAREPADETPRHAISSGRPEAGRPADTNKGERG